ncbi:MAG TPA: hypothetical protein VK789_28285 [Bryobacteraceae bacterium]|jgi:hypothetical protein|nr:hypothetical protein [Bryobacteraceae bacterium]
MATKAKTRSVNLTMSKLRDPIIEVQLTGSEAQRIFNTGFDLKIEPAEVVKRALASFCAPAPAATEECKGCC